MTEQTSPTPEADSIPDPAEEQEVKIEGPTDDPQSKSLFSIFLTPLVGLVVILAGYFGMLFFWRESLYGPAIPNLVRVSSLGLIPLLFTIWLLIFAELSRKAVIGIFVGMLVLIGGFICTLRSVEFDGDMLMTLHYRWEPVHDDVLAAHREKVASENVSDESTPALFPVVQPTDAPAYRGADRLGIVTGPPISTDWNANPPKELWRAPIGGGYSAFAVVGNYAFTLEQRGENEVVSCYDTTTGHEIWIYEYPARFYEAMGGLGPRATPTIDENRVYTVGAVGDVNCLDAVSGELIWKKNPLEHYNIPNVTWGISSSPLIVEDTVVINPGGPKGNGLIAYNKLTGEEVWKCEGLTSFTKEEGFDKNLCGYSSPTLIELHGVRQILNFDGFGLAGHNPETGKQLWSFQHENNAGVNVAQPILLDENQFFISSSYGNGSALVKVNYDGKAWSTEKVWQNSISMRCKFTSPVLHNGYVYGLDEGILMCLDPINDKKMWKRGRYGHGQVLLVDGNLLIISEKGDLVLVEANPEKFNEIASIPVLKKSAKVWNPHTLVNGIVYVRDHVEMAAYDLRKNTQQNTSSTAESQPSGTAEISETESSRD